MADIQQIDSYGMKRRQRALKKYPMLFARVAMEYTKIAKHKLGHKLLTELAGRFPNYHPYYIALAHCLTNLYRKDEAIQVLEQYLQQNGFQRKVIEMLARLYNEVGEKKKSIGMWFQIFQIDPFDAECYRKLEDAIIHYLEESNPDFVKEIKPLLIDAWVLYAAVDAFLNDKNVIEAAQITSRNLSDAVLQMKEHTEKVVQKQQPQSSSTYKPSQTIEKKKPVEKTEKKEEVETDPFGLGTTGSEEVATKEEIDIAFQFQQTEQQKENVPIETISREEVPFKTYSESSSQEQRDSLTPIVLDIQSFKTYPKPVEREKPKEPILQKDETQESVPSQSIEPVPVSNEFSEISEEETFSTKADQEISESEISNETRDTFEDLFTQPTEQQIPDTLEKSHQPIEKQAIFEKQGTPDFEEDRIPFLEKSKHEVEVSPTDIETEISPYYSTQSVDAEQKDIPEYSEFESPTEIQISAADLEKELPIVPTTPSDKERSSAKRKSRPLVTRTLAEIYAKQGAYQRALEIYQELLQMNPNKTEYLQRIEELKQLSSQERIENKDEESD
ncbi:MAG: hypothetical protein N2450_01610 [bacterium]|nr:hypothetical protein [bacterium]